MTTNSSHPNQQLDSALDLTKLWITHLGRGTDATEVTDFLRKIHETIGALAQQRTVPQRGYTSSLLIDLAALDLIPHASTAAAKLKADFPAVIFTSGRRGVKEQADAMAGNIVKNRQYIKETYAQSDEREQLQKWVDDNPNVTDRSGIAAGLANIMKDWTDNQKVRLSRHFAGLAFDVSPSSGTSVKEAIQKLPELVKFLDSEGGLTIWHAEFKKK